MSLVANANDKAISDHFMQAADEILRSENHIPAALPPKIPLLSCRWLFGFLADWSGLFQSVATAVLVTLLCLIPKMR